MRLVIDSESDGFKYEATRVWCICAVDLVSGARFRWGPEHIPAALEVLKASDEIIGHNILGHDLPLFNRLYPDWGGARKVTDTFVLSSLLRPDRAGGHSLANFGEMMGRPKPVHEDWSQFSEAMMHRCSEDVEINLWTYNKLMEEMGDWDWARSIQLEQDIAEVNAQQELNGVNFDVGQAHRTLEKIDTRLSEVVGELEGKLPRIVRRPYKQEVKKPFLKSGGHCKSVRDWFAEQANLVGGPFSRIEWANINLNSPEQVKTYLLSQGWKPTEWNYKKDGKRVVKDAGGRPIRTSPKLTEDSYPSIKGGLGQLIAEYNVLKHRRSLISNVRQKDGELTGWLNLLRSDGRIEAGGIPMGTPTGRYRHKNVVNVPKAEDHVILGKEMRELFIPSPGYWLVGSDAKALENRIEGHYTAYYDGGKYANSLLEGDPHTVNATAFSEACNTEIKRSIAKNIKYAITYGAQPAKVAETAGVRKKYGKVLYDAFWEANPALAALQRDVEKQYKRKGYLRGIDGRKLHIRSSHAILNTLFQSTGSLVVKQATILLWKHWVPEHGLDAKIVIHQHDEWQAEVNPEHLKKYIELSLKSFVQSGKGFDLNIPIEGDVKVGRNWAETH